MSTPLTDLTLAELRYQVPQVHDQRREAGHTAEVHFERCEHPSCVALRLAMAAKEQAQ